jgi:hypothetical protein
MIAIIEKIWKRKMSVAAFWSKRRNPNSAVRVPERELPQEYSIDDAEEGCVRTNPQRQREHGRREKSRPFHQRAQAAMDIF